LLTKQLRDISIAVELILEINFTIVDFGINPSRECNEIYRSALQLSIRGKVTKILIDYSF